MNAQIKRLIRNADVPPFLYEQLDKNFQLVPEEYGPYSVDENYTFKSTDLVDSLQVDATAGAITITLPPPTGTRRRRVIKTDASGNAVTVASSHNINGAGTVVLAAQYDFVWVEPAETTWLIIGS